MKSEKKKKTRVSWENVMSIPNGVWYQDVLMSVRQFCNAKQCYYISFSLLCFIMHACKTLFFFLLFIDSCRQNLTKAFNYSHRIDCFRASSQSHLQSCCVCWSLVVFFFSPALSFHSVVVVVFFLFFVAAAVAASM